MPRPSSPLAGLKTSAGQKPWQALARPRPGGSRPSDLRPACPPTRRRQEAVSQGPARPRSGLSAEGSTRRLTGRKLAPGAVIAAYVRLCAGEDARLPPWQGAPSQSAVTFAASVGSLKGTTLAGRAPLFSGPKLNLRTGKKRSFVSADRCRPARARKMATERAHMEGN